MPLPKFPKVKTPKIEDVLSVIDTASGAIDKGLGLIDKVSDKLDQLGISDAPLAITTPQKPPEEKPEEEIATGCLPCAVSHFSTSPGLLNEAGRFKGEGMTSNQILDRIAGAIEEQNSLERVDLSPIKIQTLPEWEKPIAEEALKQSRQLRHRLEGIHSTDELEQIAADTKRYYLKLNRQWYKGRFGHLGSEKAEAIAQRVGETRKQNK